MEAAILTHPSCSLIDAQVMDDEVFMALNLPMGKDNSWSQLARTSGGGGVKSHVHS